MNNISASAGSRNLRSVSGLSEKQADALRLESIRLNEKAKRMKKVRTACRLILNIVVAFLILLR